MGSIFNKIGGAVSKLVNKTITANGTYNASSDNADGYSQVVVNVNQSTETKNITANGSYTPTSGKIGFSQVTVNVPQSSRVQLWSGWTGSDIAVDLSGYNFVYIAVADGYHTSWLLLQVGGAVGYGGGIPTWNGVSYGVAKGYQATTSGIHCVTNSRAGGSDSETGLNISAVYGITNLS